jgi:hypothetical protein
MPLYLEPQRQLLKTFSPFFPVFILLFVLSIPFIFLFSSVCFHSFLLFACLFISHFPSQMTLCPPPPPQSQGGHISPCSYFLLCKPCGTSVNWTVYEQQAGWGSGKIGDHDQHLQHTQGDHQSQVRDRQAAEYRSGRTVTFQ